MCKWHQPPNPLKGELRVCNFELFFLNEYFIIYFTAKVPPSGGGGGYFTSTASRNPLPSKLKANTNNIMANPGIKAIIGLWVMMKL